MKPRIIQHEDPEAKGLHREPPIENQRIPVPKSIYTTTKSKKKQYLDLQAKGTNQCDLIYGSLTQMIFAPKLQSDILWVLYPLIELKVPKNICFIVYLPK